MTEFLSHGAFTLDGDDILIMIGPQIKPITPSDEHLNTPFKQDRESNSSIWSISFPLFEDGDRYQPLSSNSCFRIPLRSFFQQIENFSSGDQESPPLSLNMNWAEGNLAEFEKNFATIQNMISQGQIEKAVPVSLDKSTFKMNTQTKKDFILKVLNLRKPYIPYGFWNNHEGIIGATPELLFSTENQTLKTMALAGTLSKKDGTAHDLLRSKKDLHEHKLVIDDLVKKLSPFGTVKIDKTEVLELPTLYHLKTDLTVQSLSGYFQPAELLAKLHPTAALGVSPRDFGWRWLLELPGQKERRRLGSPMTWTLSEHRTISLVAIRCLQWNTSELRIGAGCGLVANSQLSHEWQEIKNKKDSIRLFLGIK